ncbi:unnamed protein product [Rotaria sp. Silwood2]|nr:unnamed protein product [Rotaria sp. Silwood2]
MTHSSAQLNDLTDEILMIIFKNLNNDEILYSLVGVNKRLNTLVHDSAFTSHVTLMRRFSKNSIHPLSDTILDRFLQILPSIRHKVQWLDVESSSMERILLSTNYPNLYGLGLYNLEIEKAKYLFTNETILTDLFKNQISSLTIRIRRDNKHMLTNDKSTMIFTDIFTMFTNLQYLNFKPSSNCSQRLSFHFSPPIFISSTLLKLHVNVDHFDDCLYLLDGRFTQLRVLHVNTFNIRHSSHLTINNTENLPNLKCFSLYCDADTSAYDELIVPLLHRMLNLEKLHLYLIICYKNTFIDGNNLKRNILNQMPKLNKFTFDIRSSFHLHNQISLLSNEDIQHTFNDFQNNQIISCVDYFYEFGRGECHIYSYPYKREVYPRITNNFPGGIFKYVREISLFDERPFEHKFFFQISQSFPFMQKLILCNGKPQNDKQSRKLDDNNQNLSIIEYPNLSYLDLVEAHDDYVEQFLVDTNTCLPNNLFLLIDYQTLKRVTEDLTRKTTRTNCTKLGSLGLVRECEIPEYLKQYFPHTKIL